MTKAEGEAAGDRLYAALRAIGASDEEAQDTCFAGGQRIAAIIMSGAEPDLEALVEETIARFRRGERDRPGPELAAELVERYPMTLSGIAGALRLARKGWRE